MVQGGWARRHASNCKWFWVQNRRARLWDQNWVKMWSVKCVSSSQAPNCRTWHIRAKFYLKFQIIQMFKDPQMVCLEIIRLAKIIKIRREFPHKENLQTKSRVEEIILRKQLKVRTKWALAVYKRAKYVWVHESSPSQNRSSWCEFMITSEPLIEKFIEGGKRLEVGRQVKITVPVQVR